MGGQALKQCGVTTRRATASEYHKHLVPEIVERLRAVLPDTEITVIPGYRNKPDFGDVDILLNSATLPDNHVDRILDGFKPTAHINNGPVLSFDFDDFQVDLIRYGPPMHDFAARYFAYNDLCNLIGRVARGMGMIFGHAGLFYLLRDADNEDRVIAKLLVTRDFDQALSFLGYDPAAHAEGFDDMEAIYRYAVSLDYYTPAPFALENRGHRARVRDRKRPTYRAFLTWTAYNTPDAKPGAGVTPDEHLRRAQHTFPLFAADYHAELRLHQLDQVFRAAYNGRVVGEITGLEGKALGRAMAAIAAAAGGKDALRDRVLRLTRTLEGEAAHAEVAEMIGHLLDGNAAQAG